MPSKIEGLRGPVAPFTQAMETDLLKFLSLVPTESLERIILEATIKPEERWETPFVNHHKIGFDTMEEVRIFLSSPMNSDIRRLSFTFKYRDTSYIYYDIIAGKVKVYNSAELLCPKTLAEKGLLGPSGLFQYFEIVF